MSNGRSSTAQWLGAAAIVAGTAAFLLWQRKRKTKTKTKTEVTEEDDEIIDEPTSSLPDISVPEALLALALGEPKSKRAQAARALTAILDGEFQVLEEVLDEAAGAHPEYGRSGRSADGRGVLGVVLDDLIGPSEQDSEAFADFLLQCTSYDPQWQADDEWNEFTQRAVRFLADKENAGLRLTAAQCQATRGGRLAVKLQALQQRIAGERLPSPEHADSGEVPGMLSMNTRVQCASCMQMRPDLLRCTRCRNVAYCSAQHMRDDVARHSEWCFPA